MIRSHVYTTQATLKVWPLQFFTETSSTLEPAISPDKAEQLSAKVMH